MEEDERGPASRRRTSTRKSQTNQIRIGQKKEDITEESKDRRAKEEDDRGHESALVQDEEPLLRGKQTKEKEKQHAKQRKEERIGQAAESGRRGAQESETESDGRKRWRPRDRPRRTVTGRNTRQIRRDRTCKTEKEEWKGQAG